MHLSASPTVKTVMLIRRPVTDVFEALTDPGITSKFWYTKGSGRLETGKRLRWDWEMYGVGADVDVLDVERNRRVVFEWPSRVEWLFEPRGPGRAFITVTNGGFAGSGDEIVAEALDSMGGFSFMLAALKAFLEHGVVLRLVEDHNPDGLAEGWRRR